MKSETTKQMFDRFDKVADMVGNGAENITEKVASAASIATEKISSAASTTAEMVGKGAEYIGEKLPSMLSAVAEKVGIASTALWKMYVWQAVVLGIRDLIVCLIFTAVSAGCVFTSIHFGGFDHFWNAGVIVPAIIAVIAFVVAVIHFVDGFQVVANPYFWAFENLSAEAKKLIGKF
jgi:hypothetical protein